MPMALSRRDCRAALLSEEGSPVQGCFALRTALRVDSATQLHIGRNDAFTTCSGHIPIPARWYATTPGTVFKPKMPPKPQSNASRLPAEAGIRLTPKRDQQAGTPGTQPPAPHSLPPPPARPPAPDSVYKGCTRDAHRVHKAKSLVLPASTRRTPLVHRAKAWRESGGFLKLLASWSPCQPGLARLPGQPDFSALQGTDCHRLL